MEKFQVGDQMSKIFTQLISIILSPLIISCAGYNTPFIDVNETVGLKEGQSPLIVQKLLGKPLIVKSGENNLIIWVYEVRQREVQSNIDGSPNKSHEIYQYSDPIHNLELVFSNGKLQGWGPANQIDPVKIDEEDKNESVESENLVKKSDSTPKAIGFFPKLNYNLSLQPSIGFGVESSIMTLRIEKPLINKFIVGSDLIFNISPNEKYSNEFSGGLYFSVPIVKYNNFTLYQSLGYSIYWELEEYYYDEYRTEWEEIDGFYLENSIDFRFSNPKFGINGYFGIFDPEVDAAFYSGVGLKVYF